MMELPTNFGELCYLINVRQQINRKRLSLVATICSQRQLLNALELAHAHSEYTSNYVIKYMEILARTLVRLSIKEKKLGFQMKKKQKVISAMVKSIPGCKLFWNSSWGVQYLNLYDPQIPKSKRSYHNPSRSFKPGTSTFEKLAANYLFRSELEAALKARTKK